MNQTLLGLSLKSAYNLSSVLPCPSDVRKNEMLRRMEIQTDDPDVGEYKNAMVRTVIGEHSQHFRTLFGRHTPLALEIIKAVNLESTVQNRKSLHELDKDDYLAPRLWVFFLHIRDDKIVVVIRIWKRSRIVTHDGFQKLNDYLPLRAASLFEVLDVLVFWNRASVHIESSAPNSAAILREEALMVTDKQDLFEIVTEALTSVMSSFPIFTERDCSLQARQSTLLIWHDDTVTYCCPIARATASNSFRSSLPMSALM